MQSLLPRNRGRRWPTGRMRRLSRPATCEKSPLTPALSPKSFAIALPCNTTRKHANDLGERGQNVRIEPRMRNFKSRRRRRVWKPSPAAQGSESTARWPPVFPRVFGNSHRWLAPNGTHFEFVVPPSGGSLQVFPCKFRLKAALQTNGADKVSAIGLAPFRSLSPRHWGQARRKLQHQYSGVSNVAMSVWATQAE